MGLYPGTDVWPNASLWPEEGGEVAPTVTTMPVTDITTTTANLRGSVDPNGLATHYYWEYNGGTTVEGNAGSGIAAVAVAQAISGLTSAHYYPAVRLIAYSSAGFAYGEYVSFSTDYGPNDARLVSPHEAGRAQ